MSVCDRVQFLQKLDQDRDKRVDPADQVLIDELASLGLVHMGFSDKDPNDFHQVASVTPLGKHFLNVERVESSRFRRFVYSITRWL